jgi:hypothetical protein
MLKHLLAALIAFPVIALADDALPKGNPLPEGACFEVIAFPPTRLEPSGILKINKCSGESWLLVKTDPTDNNDRASYEWTAIPVHSDPALRPGVAAKCFTFNNKKYCE